MQLKIPEYALVVLVGASGSGKSTFARRVFLPTEVLSSDFCRGLVSDDESNQTATGDAFEVLRFIAAKRLQLGRLVVVDATNVQDTSRKPLVELARQYHCLPVAIVFNLPDSVCYERNRTREDRRVPDHAIRRQLQQLRRSVRSLKREGFRYVYEITSEEQANDAEILREPLWNNRKDEHGPFDVIGDVHGCIDELRLLLNKLGYSVTRDDAGAYAVTPPPGRRAIFLGDLVDRGPGVAEVLRLVMDMVRGGSALCVPGNHDIKLLRKLNGSDVQVTHGLADTLEQLAGQPPEFVEEVRLFLDGLVSHYVLDDGNLVVAHAGMKESMQGRGSGKVREFALYGETTGETDEYGLPVRYDWAADYRGRATVVYGHTPQAEPQALNRTINIDTGCVFGGKLTAYRYPEGDLEHVQALRTYYEPARPFLEENETAPRPDREELDVLDIADVTGKRIVSTRLYGGVALQQENSVAALEVMSRFAVDPRWLIYLPPTMSPCETSREELYLEHPAEAFTYYRTRGIGSVMCEQKHMGSRAMVVACRDAEAAARRFGVTDGRAGVCYTRTGRSFFESDAMEADLVGRVRAAAEVSGFWQDFATDWVCLDCELMPWSAKAQKLITEQYAPTGAAGVSALRQAEEALRAASGRPYTTCAVRENTSAQDLDLTALLGRFSQRREAMEKYIEAYRAYCWPVQSLDDYRLAPFHVLASERGVHASQNHLWHMQTVNRYFAPAGSILMATSHIAVDVTDSASAADGIRWWEELTGSGGEGMVVKPLDFIAHQGKELLQPAVKCRGREYLRIIYGPEYTLEGNMQRLKKRSLARKRALALREFALGIEALERFVRREPLYRIHECVFGVLALESEPVDPRL